MSANYTEYYLQLIDRRTGRPLNDDSGVYNVLTADDPSEVTIYSDDTGTSASNPGTMTDGIIQFWTASSVSSVDVSVLTANGHAVFLQAVTPSQHRICIDPEKQEYVLIVPYQVVGASETVVDTGFDLAANMLVKDVFLHATTLGTGATLDVGTSTDTDGFVDGISVAATGMKIIAETGASAHQIGALIASTTGANVRKLHVRANATSGANIVYINTTSSSTAGEGYIYLTYRRLPTQE